MRFLGSLLVSLFILSSCASQKTAPNEQCSRELGFARGLKDARAARGPDLTFLQGCGDEMRQVSLSAYREAFDGFKIRHAKEEAAEAAANAAAAMPVSLAGPVTREPAQEGWVCEVEANSKIFTGTGSSKDEALGSARKTCGSHFTASHCSEAECKKSTL